MKRCTRCHTTAPYVGRILERTIYQQDGRPGAILHVCQECYRHYKKLAARTGGRIATTQGQRHDGQH